MATNITLSEAGDNLILKNGAHLKGDVIFSGPDGTLTLQGGSKIEGDLTFEKIGGIVTLQRESEITGLITFQKNDGEVVTQNCLKTPKIKGGEHSQQSGNTISIYR